MIKLYIILVIIIFLYLIGSNIEGFEMENIKFTKFDKILDYSKNSYNNILNYTENSYNDIKKYINNNFLKENESLKTHKSEKCDSSYNQNSVSPYYGTSYFDFNNF